jgi:hypothetical protein
MATTTGGTTYVTSTDLVADYPTASLALANRVDVVASGGPNNTKTGNYTITLADILEGDKFLYNSASPGTFTLPTSGLVDGMTVNVVQIGAGALTVTGGTIVGTTATTAQYQGLQFVYASTGTTWYSVAPNATAPGLAIVTPTSIANSGGSASASGGAITFTGVTSVSLNGAFTSTYANYRILVSLTGSTLLGLRCRLRAAGSDISAANSYRRCDIFQSASATVNGANDLGTEANIGTVQSTTTSLHVLDMNQPLLTSWKTLNGMSVTDDYFNNYGITLRTNTAADGITFYGSTGTLTGTVRVYGYRNS